MNLDACRKLILSEVGKRHIFLLTGIRNQKEKFEGVITKVFPSIFMVELNDGKVLSFNYSDYIIKNIKILY